MSLQHLPTDLKITDKVGRPVTTLVAGDTVTFVYEGERRTVLVLDNSDGQHLKGIAKERQGDYRNYLWWKIIGHKYAKPFVKQNVAVTYEIVPQENKLIRSRNAAEDFSFINKNGESFRVYVHGDSIGIACKSLNVDNTNVTADEFHSLLNQFLAE